MEEKHSNFPGTYFSSETLMRIVKVAKIASWVIVSIYAAQLFIQFVANVLMIARGYWTGMGYTDMAMSFLMLLEVPLRGVVYFIVLQAVAQVLMLYMDIEDNTRRAARALEK